MTAKHADFDALSAFVDGEAPEWADHVAGCPRCRATAAELRALSARVGAPADPPPAAQREAAIAAALGVADVDVDGAAGEGAGAGATRRLEPAVAARRQLARERSRSRWAPQSWAMPAIAAVVLACVGFAGVILSSTRSTDHEATTLAGPALDSKTESAVAGSPSAPVGDLGDVPDAATLRARALGLAPAVAAGGTSAATSGRSASSSSSNSGTASDAQSSATNAGSTGAAVSSGAASGGAGGAGGSAAQAAPNATSSAGGGTNFITPSAPGTRPCEERARAREPGLGPVTYFATARRANVPTYVLGFSSGSTVTLLMLAQDGCAELLRSAGP
jgi:hypothetical protein